MHLGLFEFPASELVHIIAPIGATFLRQRVDQMRASSKRPRVEPSGVAPPPPPSSTGDTTTKVIYEVIHDICLYFVLCEIKKLFMFYLYFPHMRLCVC